MKFGHLNRMRKEKKYPSVWYSENNKKLSCKEKILILNENIEEFHELASEIFDEAILMGVKKKQIEEVLANVINNIDTKLKSDN